MRNNKNSIVENVILFLVAIGDVYKRQEILKQAAESFKNVRDSDDYGFFNGDSKCTEKSVIFA